MTPPRRSPPPVFPLGRPAKGGWFRRMPPAVFPGVLGLLWLGLAWRGAAAAFALPSGLVDGYLGAVTLLWVFAVVAYAGKALRRPAVVAEDLRILPGRDGLAALALSVPAVALVLAPIRPGLATGLMMAGLYLVYIFVLCVLKPEMGPRIPPEPGDPTFLEKLWISARNLVPPVIMIFAVLGSILFGLASPTEAAAIGSLCAVALTKAVRQSH